jgi:long-chain acyl-CoA synthetase
VTTARATASPLETRTAAELWRYAAAQEREAPAYLEEHLGGWEPVSWGDAETRVDRLAHALLASGVRPGDAVAVLARTRLEWILLDWAIMSIGAVVVGLYPTNTARECEYILAHSEAVLAFVEDAEQRLKLASVATLNEIVGFDELAAFMERAGDQELPVVGEDDLATLIYTSGTTGPPKGCMLTHRNLVTAAVRVKSQIGLEDTVVLFLPLAHSFARIVHHSAAYHGATLALVSDVVRLPEAIAAARPTILPAVPRVY